MLDRETALKIWTQGSAWFSGEADVKGTLAPGQYADLAVLSADYMAVPSEEIRRISAALTIVGGKIVHASDDFPGRSPPLPPASPAWSPINAEPSPAMRAETSDATPLTRACHDGCASACGVHGHSHQIAWTSPVPVSDKPAFWGALGCSCFAV